jgi:hypothetical protein
MPTPVKLDFSKAQPISQGDGGVTLDFSKAQPIAQSTPAPSMTAAPQPSMLQRGMNMAGDVLQGVGKGAMSTLSPVLGGITYGVQKGSQMLGVPPNLLGQVPESMGAATSDIRKQATPTNMAQKVGHGGEQVAEFLIPGGAEKTGALKLAEFAPKLGRFAEPLAHAFTSALGSGAVNALQGGSPLAGAAMGAGGSLAGDVLKAAAPAITEFAQGIHTPGATTGKAILAETRGVMPESIRRSARGVLDELNPQLDQAAKAASVRANPARAMLAAPPQEIPLAEPWIPDTPGELIPAAPFPRRNIVGGSSPRVAAELGSTEATIPPRLTRDDLFMHSGVREPTALPTSGPGVLIRPAESTGGPMPTTIPNASMSLQPARQTAQEYVDKAASQNLPKFIKGTKNLADQVNVWKGTGEPIPENVTPWEGLQLKRGVGAAVSPTKWRPGYNDPFTGAQKAVYGQLNHAFEGAVPEAASLNARISALIPATEPGATSFSRYVSPAVGTMMGGYTGAMRGLQSGEQGEPNLEKAFIGGITGAALGGLTGYAAPTAMNVFARTANSPVLQRVLIPAATGAALQADRNKKEQ